MTTFTGEAKIGFGFLGFLSHLLIALSVLLVIFSIPVYFYAHLTSSHELAETFGLAILFGGGGVLGGIGFGFLNMFIS